jgi:hypothetical protein
MEWHDISSCAIKTNSFLKNKIMKTNLLKSSIVAVLILMSTKLMAFTAVASGAWSNPATWGGVGPGATVSNNDIVIPNAFIVSLDMDVTFSGALNSFTVDGTINSPTGNNLTISTGSFAGAGTVGLHRLSFSGLLATSTFTGILNIHVLQNQGATLTLTALTNISDTLDLDGGNLLLNSGCNLTLLANSNVRVNNGTITANGGLFTTGNPYDAWYVGASKTTGLEANSSSLRDVHLNMNNNTQIVSQGITNLIINGSLVLGSGQFNINGNHLILKGDLSITSGAMLSSNSSSDLTIQGSGALSSNLVFAGGSMLNNLTIQRTTNGNVALSSAVGIAGTLALLNGTFDLVGSSVLTMNAGSDIQLSSGVLLSNGGAFNGTASYNVEYIGGNFISGIEISGSGLNNVTIGLLAATSYVQLGSDLTVGGNLNLTIGQLSLSGKNVTVNGTYDQSPTAYIIGDSTSKMTMNLTSSTNDTIYFASGSRHLLQLVVNIPAASTISLGTNLVIHDQLNLMSGKLEIFNSDLHFSLAGFISGYNDTKYISTSGSGQVWMNVNINSPYVVFPVGSASAYAPAQIQQTSSGTSGMFAVRVMNGVYSQGLTGTNLATSESVVNKTWEIDAAVGVTVNMNLKLGWVVADEMNGFNRNLSYISHFNSNWDMYLSSAAVSGSNNTYVSTRMGITSLSPFAVVDTSALLSTENLSATSMHIYPNPSTDNITIETGTGHGNYLYELLDANGKLIYSVSNSEAINRISFDGFTNGLYFVRVTDPSIHSTIIKRVVKQ